MAYAKFSGFLFSPFVPTSDPPAGRDFTPPQRRLRPPALLAGSVFVMLGLAVAVTAHTKVSAADELALLHHLAADGDDGAELQLALAYEDGRSGVPPDMKQAVLWLRKSATAGNAYAADRLANHFADGRGVTLSTEQAVAWWRRAAEHGNADAQYRLGRYLAESGKKQEAVHWLQRAAVSGWADAERQFSALGGELQPTPDQLDHIAAAIPFAGPKAASAVWDTIRRADPEAQRADRLRQAVTDGDALAEYQLALHYRDGMFGVKRDPAQAVFWLRRAAGHGNRLAMQTLAQAYRVGELGLTPDPSQAARWQRRAEKPAIRVD